MKHFVITTTIGSTEFTHCCDTAYEALRAIVDLQNGDSQPPAFDRDKIMALLIDMKRSDVEFFECRLYSIRYGKEENND